MSVNKYLPDVLVIPEDDANRQIANGFLLDESLGNRRIQILPEAGGWCHVLHQFEEIHVPGMNALNERFLVLLIDYDEDDSRFTEAQKAIPEALRDRVFVLGGWSNPERLKAETGDSFEAMGRQMAKECREEVQGIWTHPLLSHNASELARLRIHVCPFLFS